MARFQPAVDFAIWNETSGRADGVLIRDPKDPGGTTKWGIAQRSHPGVNIAALSRADACAIYIAEYWEPAPGLALLTSQRIATKIFDTIVHLGVRGGCLAAQRTANYGWGAQLREDGKFGPQSAAAINFINEQDYLTAFAVHMVETYELICERHDAKGDTGYRARFLKGFVNRARRMPT